MSFYRGRGRGRGRGVFARNSKPDETNPTALLKVENKQDKYTKCNKISLDLNLDPATEKWFAELRKAWNLLKKSPSVVHMIHQQFDSCENPYEQVLRLIYNCLDFKYSKPKSLSYLITEEFKTWAKAHIDGICHLLTQDIKISAFNIVQQQNLFSLKKLIADIYEMAKDCDIFLDIIKGMIQEKHYKEACQSAALLGLHNKFTIEEFLIPLILQDKLICVEEFLADSPQHQLDLVSFLDSLMGQSVSIKTALEPIIIKLGVSEIKYEKMHYKPWRKLVTRFVKIYNLPPDVSPCLNKKRNEGALQFLLHKRFVENSFGNESWREMIQEAVKDDKRLQQDLVVQVAFYGDLSEALWWVTFYSISRDYWPASVRLFHDNPEKNRHQQNLFYNQIPKEPDWSCQEQTKEPIVYHKLKLPSNCINLIDTQESFEQFLDNGLQNVNIVGIDCEWKPTFGLQKNELALMQIATRKAVFIFDVIKLGSKLAYLWQELGKFLFNDCDILKLGFAFSSDFSMIKQSIPNLMFSHKQIGYLDLMALWKQIEKCPKVVFPYEVQSKGPSLSTLVHQCLGYPLDKSDQFSNWEKRPLRESQLIYASLDAYCLIQVYDVLKRCCESANFPFEETCYTLMSSTKSSKRKPKKHVQKKKSCDENKTIPQPPSPHAQSVPANSVKLVCDTMLQGLGKSLRRCGINTAILENEQDHMDCVRSYQDEKRYILTRGQIFNKLMGTVPHGYCFKVTSDDIDEQLKEVLDYYKIFVTKNDVFSRCQTCNSNNFVKISRSTMNALSLSCKKPVSTMPADYGDFHLADEATGFSSDEDVFEENCPSPISSTRKWDIYADEKVDVGLCLTRLGVKIQVDAVPYEMLRKIELFYVCEYCGKVYWDGSHFDKVLSGRLQGILI